MKYKKNIIYFANNKKMASTRYRGVYVLNYLQNKYDTIDYKIIYHDKKNYPLILFYILMLLLGINNSSIYIFQKTCTRNTYTLLLRIILNIANNTIYDIDDAVYTVRDELIVQYFVKKAKKVTVGSRRLKEYCSKLNVNTFLLTTPIPSSINLKQNKEALFTIGWIGFFGVHRKNLKSIVFPILKNLAFDFRLTLLGIQSDAQKEEVLKYFRNNDNISIDMPLNINWQDENKITSIIAGFDIGIMPLIDNEISRAKSAFKIKQYLSVGVPVIASPVGENLLYVKNSYNGYLCDNNICWKEKIEYFHKINNELYKKYSTNALETYRDSDFKLDIISEKFYSLLNI